MASKSTPAEETVPEVMSFGDDSSGWRPEPGDTITGTIANITVGGGAEYDPYPIIQLKDASDNNDRTGLQIDVHAFHQALQDGFALIEPEIGHQVTVTYHGVQGGESKPGAKDGKGKGKTGYHKYTVTSPQYKFNWKAWNKKKLPLVDVEE